MVSITINEDAISLTGHTKTEVCAAISTIMCTAYNILERCCGLSTFGFSDDGTTMTLTISHNVTDDVRDKVIEVVVSELCDLAKDYKDCIDIIQIKK